MDIILKYFPDLTELQLKQLTALEELYRKWNQKINVISRKDIDGLYENHVLHSLSIAAAVDLLPISFEPGSGIIDIGTGGGFPGIPLAIYFPEVKFHLVDSIAKKIKVVNDIVDTIGLNNVTSQHTRAEEIKDRKFDFVISRAVAPLKELWKWSKLLLRHKVQGTRLKEQGSRHKVQGSRLKEHEGSRDGGLICLKGGDLALEISESGTHPRVIEIVEIFRESYFEDKYLLYVQK
jgi:16S rRNA (guanine527-N7)-methyltransferase